MKLNIITLGLAAALSLSVTVSSAQETATPVDTLSNVTTDIIGGFQCADPASCTIAGIRFGNPIRPSTWWNVNGGSKAGATIAFNFIDPDFWMMFAEPDMRSVLHAAMLNPQTWGQFLEVETYTNMMDVSLLSKWIELDTYDAILDPQTYAYFMQPGAYSHLIEVEHYTQFTQLSSYDGILDSALGVLNLVN